MLKALGELSSKSCGCILIVSPARQLLGTFTDGDLRRTLQQRRAQVLLKLAFQPPKDSKREA